MSAPLGENWGADPMRAPTLADGDELLYCEHGRISNRVDCRSHWFRLVKNGTMHILLVKHGGGQERINLGYNYKGFPAMFDPLDSDARYWLMHLLHDTHRDSARNAQECTAQTYKQAFADGRLKKRKQRGRDAVKIWIEPERIEARP